MNLGEAIATRLERADATWYALRFLERGAEVRTDGGGWEPYGKRRDEPLTRRDVLVMLWLDRCARRRAERGWRWGLIDAHQYHDITFRHRAVR